VLTNLHIVTPEIQNRNVLWGFCFLTTPYTKHELIKMESDIFKLLQFKLGNPTIKIFLRRFTRSGHEDKNRSILLMEFLGSYLPELSLMDYGCLRFLPSVVAATVMFVARLTIDPDVTPWVRGKIDLRRCLNIMQWIFLFLKAHYPFFSGHLDDC